MFRKMHRKLAHLDPEQDYQQIVYLLQCYEFPWDFERSLEFALFRTYAVPAVSGLLAQTGEFTQRPRKRYDDTELLLAEITEHGFDSERGQAALKRINEMHGRYAINNDEFIYVLSTFIFEPIRWIDRYGWRKLTDNEKQALYLFYRELGHRMHIRNIPNDRHGFEHFNRVYEQQHFRYASTNALIGNATRDLLLGFYLPKWLWPVGKPIINTFLDQPLLTAFGLKASSSFLVILVRSALKCRRLVLKVLPSRRRPHRQTQVKRPTYPQGYRIEALGIQQCKLKKL